MIVAVLATILLVLELARRALEPECPHCSSKEWAAHSTQLQCMSCGWSNLAPALVTSSPEATEYELGIKR